MHNKFKFFLTAAVTFTLAVSFITSCLAGAKNKLSEKNYDVRIISANLLAHYESWGGIPVDGRDELFIQLIADYEPDVAGLQEICEDWRYCLNAKLPSNYSFVDTKAEGDFVHMTAMIYNRNTVTLKACGETEFSMLDDNRTRRIVWAVFETNNNQRFAVTSTHFSFFKNENTDKWLEMTSVQSEEMCKLSEQIKNEYNCPVFLTGDFNTSEFNNQNNYSYVVYEKLCKTLTDAKYIAQSTFDGEGLRIESPNLDHIFINGSASVMQFGYISDSKWKNMSDHYPVSADVKL